jgi:hypothetical protein
MRGVIFSKNCIQKEVIRMAEHTTRGTIKFVVWTAASLALIYYCWWSYSSGQMVSWYYYKAKTDGYAVNANYVKPATKEKPITLEIGQAQEITGLQAVPVKKGERLPKGCNGIISKKDLEEGKRVKLEGNTITVLQGIKITESKGFKYKDSYMHKGIETNPWSGAWNLAMVIGLGLTLGLMAEGFTDMVGIKITKIKHFEGAH